MSPNSLRIDTDPDPACLEALERQCCEDPWTADTYRAMLRNPVVGAWALLDQAGTPVGLLCFQRVSDEGEIQRLAIVPERRGAGLGRFLLVRLLTHLAEAGVRRVFLEVRAGNDVARRLYRAAGFRERGRRAGYFQTPPDDALLYDLTLA